MGYTKGPWKARRHVNGTYYVETESRTFIAEVTKDNVQLIAAAPDLLTTCEQVAAWIAIDPNFQDWPAAKSYLNQLQQAIQKAKGEVSNA